MTWLEQRHDSRFAEGESVAEALFYNGLVQTWPGISRLAREAADQCARPVRPGLFAGA